MSIKHLDYDGSDRVIKPISFAALCSELTSKEMEFFIYLSTKRSRKNGRILQSHQDLADSFGCGKPRIAQMVPKLKKTGLIRTGSIPTKKQYWMVLNPYVLKAVDPDLFNIELEAWEECPPYVANPPAAASAETTDSYEQKPAEEVLQRGKVSPDS